MDSSQWLEAEGLEARWGEIEAKQLTSEFDICKSRTEVQRQFSKSLQDERQMQMKKWKDKRLKQKSRMKEQEAELLERIDAYIEAPEAKKINSKFYLQKKHIRNTLR